jgi:tripartite-type tricarboxylate transporter receptor subunit TctC
MQKPYIRGALGLMAVLAALVAPQAHAEPYPSRPITIVVPFPAGSGTDRIARGLSEAIGAEWHGTPVIIENRPGASGIIAAQFVARAPADGYTLFMTTNTTQSANQYLFKKLPYDPVADFAPITALAKGAMVLAVPVTSPVKTYAELLAYAKTKVVSFGAGNSSSRVAGEQFKQMTGLEMTYVPYKGNPQAVTDLLGGQLDLMFPDMATALPLLQSGKLRALGYTGVKRSAALPNTPTLNEEGLKGYELSYWVAAYAPKGTPADIVKRLNELLQKCVQTESLKNIYASSVLEVFTTTPEGLAQFQRAESTKWGAVIKAAGIVPE